MWIADYILAAILQDAYDSDPHPVRTSNSVAPANPITPEKKADLGQTAEDILKHGTAPRPVDGDAQIREVLRHDRFWVYKNLPVEDGDRACTLEPGDSITPMEEAEDNLTVRVKIENSSHCPPDLTPRIRVEVLSDMLNNVQAQAYKSIEQLELEQGKGALPDAPHAAGIAAKDGQAAPDPNAKSQVWGAGREADNAEGQALRDAGGGTGK